MAPAIPVEVVGQRVLKKVQKVSKGQSSEFAPDYGHAVETMSELKCYGGSSPVDTKITDSELSCAPRNNLNCDSYQQFGVPMQVLALSELSGFERKQLESRLKRELEQVRTFQKIIEEGSLKSGGKRKHIHQFSQPVKKRVLTTPPATGNAMLMKQCDTLLKRLMGHNFGWVFNTPVDAVSLNIPDYYMVIKHPMDLGTIKTKLNSGKYVDPWGFVDDVRLTFSNAMTYNPRGNDVHVMAETLSKFFEVRWKPIEKKLAVTTDSFVSKRRIVLETEPESATLMPPSKKKKIMSFGNERKQEPVKKIMSVDEKKKLNFELEAASLADLPESIIDFLKENCSNGNATTDDEIEIDTFGDETLFKLRKLLDEFLVDKQKDAKACEIKIHNDSRPSNSSMQAVKVNNLNEEDVDIGGNDLLGTSFPPLEIEKDTAVKIRKCSSSSSSSSDSGSSSSSDSDSESDDDANISAVENSIKDTLDSEVNLEQTLHVHRDKGGSASQPVLKDGCFNLNPCDSVNMVGQVEPKSQSIPASGEVDGCKEGVDAPSERQLSPDKLYRAALLRSRFADIILKAQENTTGKVEKQDKERLRFEKEELEKRRKEEKARLQAEAKAAEEAKRKAELVAAAEVKRKRELEREAARQALQKVEKMVVINDNSRFIEDLKLLSVAPTEPLQNSIEDPLGNFNMNRSGNPLERLGLYMKNDDEDEDEDGDLRYPLAMGHDFEKGEN